MTSVIRLEAVIENLPNDLEVMKVEAYSEGYRFLERLAKDWEQGVTRFDREGEALVVARVDDVLAGIGGLTLDPIVSGALRMRRFYVRPSFRKQCIGRKLVGTLLEYPRLVGQVVVVNASRGESVRFFV
jgi:GNAT superfamily N-acetyltransferase